MNVEQRDIFLVPFPFSDFSQRKVRPVLVMSNDQYNNSSEDVIVCGITSNIDKQKYSIMVINKDLEEGHFFGASSIKVENLLKITKRLFIKKIGRLNKKVFSDALKKLDSLFK